MRKKLKPSEVTKVCTKKECRKKTHSRNLCYYHWLVSDEKKVKRHNEWNTKRVRFLKDRCLKYKGGKCIICGYNKTYYSLAFHHLDKKEKKYNISSMCNRRFRWIKIKEELNKCILLCSNCHSEVEEGILKYEV